MSRKNPADNPLPSSLQQLPQLAKESAEQIWLAGLGAFSKAQQEGNKVFNVLVQDGMALQKQAQALAQEQLQAASARLGDLGSTMSQRAAEPLDKLEALFEQRVAKALQRLGVPDAARVEALQSQVDSLTRQLEEVRAQLPSAEPGDKPARAKSRSDKS